MNDLEQYGVGFVEWAKIHQVIGLRSGMVDISWSRVHRTTVSDQGLKAKKKTLETLSDNKSKLEAYMGQGTHSQLEVVAGRSIYRQYVQAIKDVKRQIAQIDYQLSATLLVSE